LQIAKVGEHAKAAGARNTEPRPLRFEIAAGQDARIVLPPAQWGSGAVVKFVAIAGQYEPITRVGFPSDNE
jgi:hypothetical protein